LTPPPILISKANPFSGALNTRGWDWGKLAIFDENRRLSQKRCDIGRSVLQNVKRKSWVPDRMVSSMMTSGDT